MINAFKQVRLTNSLLTVTGAGRLQVGAEQTVWRSETGVFALQSTLVSSGQYLQTLIAGSSAGVTSFAGVTGAVQATGLGNITTSISGTTLLISGNTSNLATIANLASTGATLSSQISAINTVTGGFTGQFVSLVNQQSFASVIPTGIDTYFVSFPSNFSSVPKVQASVEVTGDTMYMMNVRGRTVSGYSAIFSDTIQESGVTVNTFATI